MKIACWEVFVGVVNGTEASVSRVGPSFATRSEACAYARELASLGFPLVMAHPSIYF